MDLVIVGAIGLVALGGGVALAWFVATAGEPRARTVAMVGGFAFAVLAAIVTQALIALLGAEPALLVALSVAVLAAAALFFLVGTILARNLFLNRELPVVRGRALVSTTMVPVPDAVLLHRQLGKSAKLLWIALQHVCGGNVTAVPRTGLLQAGSGLARHTLLRALAGALVPADLLPDRRIGVQAKLLYACLQRMAGHGLRGECTYTDLSAQADISPNTAKRAARALQAAGWVEFSQHNKLRPIQFWLCNPVARRRDEAVARVDRRYKAAPHKGEALMRAYLSLVVDSDEHDDDASPCVVLQ